MVITWYGQACFRIQSGEFTLAIDPFGKEIGLTPPRFKADAVLVTHGHFDHANTQSIAGDPLIINGPGEYEIKGVSVRGIQTFHDKQKGAERGLNTIYTIDLEDIRLVHLGDFGEGILRDETNDQIGTAHVAMIPVGGTYTITGEEAAKVIKQLEPRIVIPMHYKLPEVKADLLPVDIFLKEMGAAKTEAQEKLTIKKKDVEGENEKTVVVVLKYL